MSEVIEKNDVDISSIFNWGRVYEVINPDTEEVEAIVYMKLLGDADLGRARVYALRRSSELRRKLKDLNSDERVGYIRDIDEMLEEDMINMIVGLSSRDVINEARRSVKLNVPKAPPSDAPLEKLEKFQKEVDQYPQKKEELVRKAVENALDKVRGEVAAKSKEELHKEYVKLMIDELCEREAMVAFKDMQVYLGCFKDDTYKAEKRFFSSFEDFDNLEPTMKQNFKDAYDSLDIQMGELKKLRRATP